MSPRLPAAPRLRSQGHLLRTTALVSLLSTLAPLQPVHAQDLYTLDNASPGSQPLRGTTGTWAADSQIWFNQTSSQWETLANGGIAVLGSKQGGADVTLTVDSTTPIRIDGIQVDEDGYTLTGGTLNGTGLGLTFSTTSSSLRTIDVDTALDASVIVDDNVRLRYGGTTSSAATLRVQSGGELRIDFGATTRGLLNVYGSTSVIGTHVGAIQNSGRLVLDGTVNTAAAGDQVINTGIFTQRTGSTLNMAVNNQNQAGYYLDDGSLTGTVSNTGAFSQSGGIVTGAVQNDDFYRFNAGTIVGNVTNNADFVQYSGAVIDGNVTANMSSGRAYLLRDGEVTGDFDNSGIMEAYGTIGGTLTNNSTGSVTVNNFRSLSVTEIDNSGDLILSDGSTTTGNITNNTDAEILIDDATVTGSIQSDGTIYILSDGSQVTGDLGIGSGGLLQFLGNSNATFAVGKNLTQTGNINTSGSGKLLITAEKILLQNRALVEDDGSVKFQGIEVVQASKVFSEDGSLSGGLIDGGIENEATGSVTLETGINIDGNDYAYSNFGLTELEGPGASLFNLQSFSNTGPDAQLINGGQSLVFADAMTNSGRITNDGTIGVGGASQLLDNLTEGTITNNGWIDANIQSAAGATLISTNRILGDVDNDGEAILSGTIDGELDNSNANVTLNGDLAVGNLKNSTSTAGIQISQGQTLTSAGLVENSGILTVAGTLEGETDNGGQLTVAGVLVGDVENTGTLTSTGVISGDVTNDGVANLQGRITDNLLNHTADLTLIGDLRVGRLRNSGASATITIDAGYKLTSDITAANSGQLTIDGELVGGLSNTGNVTNAGTISGPVANTGGSLTSNGTITGAVANTAGSLTSTGTITGNVTNTAGQLTSSGTIAGDLDNDSIATLSGTITGELDNSADDLTLGGDLDVGSLTNSAGTAVVTIGANQTLTSKGAVSNDGSVTVALDGTLAAQGDITNNNVMDVTGTATTKGDVTNNGTLDVAGALTAEGDLDNNDTMNVTGSASIGGDLTNDGTLDIDGTLTADGAATNSGTLTVDGALTATGGLTNDEILTIAGTVTGEVTNNDEMNLTSGAIVGNVSNAGQANVSGNSSVTGDLTNTGTITGVGGTTTLTVNGGTFLNDGTLNARSNSTLTIRADALEFGVDSKVDASRVFLEGDIVNRGQMTYDEDATLNNGGLVNKSTGSVVVSAALDAGGNDITNAGNFRVTSDSDSDGNLHNVDVLQNSGTFTIDSRGQVSANTVENHGGTMTVAGGLTGPVSNKTNGTLDLSGGTITGSVENLGDLTGTGEITGTLTNRKTADLGGSAGNTVNSGVLSTNGDLTLGTLLNTGTVRIDAGDSLTTAGAVDNQRKLEVAGTLASRLDNATGASTVLTGGTLAQRVTNDGRLTGTGTISGQLTNNGTAELAGSLSTTTNNGSLQTAGDLSISSLTNAGTTTVMSGDNLTMGSALQNQKQLLVAGTITGAVTNQSDATMEVNGGTVTGSVSNVAGSTTTLNDGSVQGNVLNSGVLYAAGDSTIGSTLVNAGTTRVRDDQKLTAGKVENGRILTVAGTLDSDVENENTGTVTLQSGTIIGDIANAGTLTGNGTVDGAVTNTGEVTSDGTLTIDQLSNNNTVNVAAGSTLASGNTVRNTAALNVAGTLQGAVTNGPRGTVALDGGTVTGAINNSGTVAGTGTLSGDLNSSGIANLAGTAQTIVNSGQFTLVDQGTLRVDALTNRDGGTLSVDSGETLTSARRVDNQGVLRLAGQLNGGVNNTGTLRLNEGNISGAVINDGTLNGSGIIGGKVTNTGRLNTTGKLTVDALTNRGTTTIGADETLVSTTAVVNEKTLDVAGTLLARLNNQSGATTTLNSGTIAGSVQNRGTLAGTGTVDGKLTTRSGGTTSMGGTVNGDLVNLGGVITPNADLLVEGEIQNSASSTLVLAQAGANSSALTGPGSFTVNQGVKVTTAGGAINGPNANMNVFGTLVGDVTNNGIYQQTGNLDGSLTTSGNASIGGAVSGNVDYAAGQLNLANGLTIGGELILRNDLTLANGIRVNAAQTTINNAATLSLGGTLGGNVANAGTLKLADHAAKVTGNLDNAGTIDLQDGDTDDVLTVGGLSGNGRAAMDISTGDRLTSDQIVVEGGAATGNLHFSLDAGTNQIAGSTLGQRVTLLNVDESLGAQNDITYTYDELSAANERIVYSIDQAGNNGDLTLVSQVNPAIGAMFANVTLVQSLIGSVINRPTSPYVTGLVVDSAGKPCGVGGWGRATGGSANVEGKTDNQVSVLENEVSADYYGMQGGIDLACFDDRFGGWDMAFGALGGVNIGDSRQPIYAINGRDSQATTGALASVTTTDFQQRYLGVYATASKDRWVADLQLRMEKTDFELKNTPTSASSTGLGITDPDFSSDGYTLSGSVSYSMPIAKTGWNLTPTVGFAWSKYSTDSIRFSEGFRMEFDDSNRKIGFVGATVSKAFIRMEENAAIQTFATATYYKDFADAAISRLYNDRLDGYDTQVMTSDNLKSYSEVSIGANYVKVLDPSKAGGGRQFSTSARIDGRFGDSIDSVGVTGQIRWQF
ncbi:hypothetical protein [Paracoccus xiamenensis]|uniref:hypothetical protein n=1 Tax=Paracoccus xiamenensis TaxID=2714901 RepID=UPI00140D0C5E|nr:hypothetical protein [Paracoccus xiamenensis]NHF73849.1 hypothetical protein [Paracoccus xiamenensis]